MSLSPLTFHHSDNRIVAVIRHCGELASPKHIDTFCIIPFSQCHEVILLCLHIMDYLLRDSSYQYIVPLKVRELHTSQTAWQV